VEDFERDAEMVLRILRKEGFEPDHQRVDDADDLRAALAAREWDVVVADHNLPNLDSLGALALVREAGLDTPFIIVSGSISDEVAVKAMRAGAQDYVLKDNLARLGPVVRRELAEAKERQARRRAEKEMREHDILFRTLINHAIDILAVINPEGNILFVSPSVTAVLGHPEEQLRGSQVLDLVHPEDAPTVVAALQARQAGSRGHHLFDCRIRHANGSWRELEVASVDLAEGSGLAGVVLSARDVTDRRLAEDRLRDSLATARRTMDATVAALAATLEMRDLYTAGHQQRVTVIALAIADLLGLSEQERATVRVAGILHDIGKIQVPAEILSKPARLSEMEMALVRTHPEVGYAILKPIPFDGPVAETVLQHHERLNGSGYPRRLTGDSILREARIIGVADVVEAMSAHRPYRPALGLSIALEEIRGGAGTWYDAAVAQACVDAFANTDLAAQLKLDPIAAAG
jgi:PAS domain S-box-containing protein/putative nucleotidyltransferase with HDIG domain